MNPVNRGSLFLRSMFVAGSWNYRDLLSIGVSWALLPVTQGDRGIAPESDDAIGGGHFNAHPYLVPLALGVFVRAIRDGADSSLVQRLKSALRGPLGSLGDQLVWGAWRPMCLVLSAIAVLLGVGPLFAVSGLLLGYNAVNLGLRWWGMNAGLSQGLEVAAAIRRADLPTRTERVKVAGVLVFGGLIGIVVVEGSTAGFGAGAFVVAGLCLAFGIVSGGSMRRWIPLLLLLAAVFGLWSPGISDGVG